MAEERLEPVEHFCIICHTEYVEHRGEVCEKCEEYYYEDDE